MLIYSVPIILQLKHYGILILIISASIYIQSTNILRFGYVPFNKYSKFLYHHSKQFIYVAFIYVYCFLIAIAEFVLIY